MCRAKKIICSVFMAPLLFAAALCANAFGVAIPQTNEQLVKNSSDVVRGSVKSVVSKWDDAHTIIFTEVTVEVGENVIGAIEKGRAISIYVPGGMVGDTGLHVEHAAQFEKGEEVIVFLTQLQGMYGVTSWEMGKFTVQNGNVREENRPVTEFINEIRELKK